MVSLPRRPRQLGSTAPKALGRWHLQEGGGWVRGRAGQWLANHMIHAENSLGRHNLKAVSQLPTPMGIDYHSISRRGQNLPVWPPGASQTHDCYYCSSQR